MVNSLKRHKFVSTHSRSFALLDAFQSMEQIRHLNPWQLLSSIVFLCDLIVCISSVCSHVWRLTVVPAHASTYFIDNIHHPTMHYVGIYIDFQFLATNAPHIHFMVFRAALILAWWMTWMSENRSELSLSFGPFVGFCLSLSLSLKYIPGCPVRAQCQNKILLVFL